MSLRRCALVLALLAALAPPGGAAWAQQTPPADSARASGGRTVREVEILSADALAQTSDGVERVRTLTGNVRMRQEKTLLWASSAVQYVDRQEIVFDGLVRIIDEGDSLRAEHVVYDSGRKIGRASGAVRLADGEVVVLAPTARYFVDEKRAEFEDGLTLVDSATTVKALSGVYWSEQERAEFAGQVRLQETASYIEADSVTYHRDTEVALARGNVYIERIGDDEEAAAPDSSRRTYLYGAWAHSDNKNHYSRVGGRPLLVRVTTDSTGAADTLLVRARTLEVSRVDSLQRLVATDSVAVLQGDLAARADSLVVDRIRAEEEARLEETRLFGGPIVWMDASQITGDTVRVVGREGRIDTLLVTGRAFLAQRDTLLDRIRQLRGERLVGVFAQDSLRTLTATPEAELIYFNRNDRDEPDGAVRTAADRVTLRFAGEALDRVEAVGGVQGTYYAEHLVPSPFALEGFRWAPEERPRRADLLQSRPPPDPPLTLSP